MPQEELKPRLVFLTDPNFQRFKVETPNQEETEAPEPPTPVSVFLDLIEGAVVALYATNEKQEEMTSYLQEFADLLNRYIPDTTQKSDS